MAVNGKRQGSYSIYSIRGEVGHANKQNLNHLVYANKLAYLCVCPGALSYVL